MSGSRRRGRSPAAFKAGEEVEVRLDGCGFKGAWYEARVRRHRPEHRRYSVVYDSLTDKADESRPLREAVAITHVRPRPPRGGGPFGLDQLVDAFYNDGWWSGIVSRVPGEQGGARYAVRFRTGEEMEFGPAELRSHFEWIGGEWVAPKSQFIKPQKLGGATAVNCKQSLYASGIPHKSKVPHIMSLRGDDDEALCKLHIYGTNSEIKNTVGSTFRSQLESSQPCKKQRKGETIEDDMRLIDCLARCTKTTSRVKTGFNVTMPTIEKRPNFHLKTFLIDKFPCSMIPFKEKRVESPNVVTEPPPITLLGGVSDEPLIPAKFFQESQVPQMPLSIIETTDRGGELTPGGNKNDQQTKALVTRDQLQQGNVPHDGGVRKLAAGKKRRRKSIPRKVRIIDTMASSEGNELKPLDGRNDARIKREHTKDEVDVSAIVDSHSISRCDEERNHEGSPSTVNHEEDSIGDQQDRLAYEPSTEGHSTSQTEPVTQGDTCFKGSEGQALSTNYMLLGTSNLHSQHNEAGSDAQNESLLSTSGIQVTSALTCPISGKSPSKKSCLPFEKCSPMWETIESMEVISKMLQQPHFRPLEQYCEVFREGMAIGLMVTYSNLVNSIGDLKRDDSHYKFAENMKTLVHLEGHGFDVQHVRACLEELLRIKNDHEQLMKKSSALKVLISEKEKEKDQLNADIDVIDKIIMELKEMLAHFYERKASVLKQQEENDSHMVKLQMDAKVVEESLQSTERDFEGILAAAW